MTRSARTGFTLLEMILATALIAVVMGVLYATLTIVLKSRDTANAAVAPAKTVLQAADLIRQDFEAVLPPDMVENGKLSGEFVGNTDTGSSMLDFYCMGNDAGWAVAPPAAALPGLGAPVTETDVPWSEGSRHVVLGLKTDVNPPMLVREVTRNLLSPVVPDPEVEILCRNVKTFDLQYFDGTDWQTEWDSTALGNALPLAVQMTLQVYVDSRPGQPPELYTIHKIFPLACAKPATATATAPGGGN
jgi:prepilin-type N-terminal cleavage/methylation domain-containing protein